MHACYEIIAQQHILLPRVTLIQYGYLEIVHGKVANHQGGADALFRPYNPRANTMKIRGALYIAGDQTDAPRRVTEYRRLVSTGIDYGAQKPAVDRYVHLWARAMGCVRQIDGIKRLLQSRARRIAPTDRLIESEAPTPKIEVQVIIVQKAHAQHTLAGELQGAIRNGGEFQPLAVRIAEPHIAGSRDAGHLAAADALDIVPSRYVHRHGTAVCGRLGNQIIR